MMDLTGKRVAVFGLGKSGISSAKLLLKKGITPILINRADPSTWGDLEGLENSIPKTMMFNQDAATDVIASVDLIILSPGISREHLLLQTVHSKNIPVISDIEFASWYCTSKYIVITGSNGKTTTTSMIYEMLKLSNKDVFVGGNIGIPFCECILANRNPEYVVLELSSFQLESMPTFHPHIALILNLFQNHGERYATIQDYANAKFNMTKNMIESDWLIYPSDYPIIESFCTKQKMNKISIDTANREQVISSLTKEISLEAFKLHGYHNKLNLLFALKVFKLLELPINGFQKMVDSFCGIEHRLQFIPSKDKFISFNDAKSTNWDALKTAISSIDKEGRPLWVIIGGQRRGKEDSILPHLPLLKKYIDKILLIGDTTDEFSKDLATNISTERCYKLESAIKFARENKFSGILLLSPAFPSYDQYKNFNKRGEHFISLLADRP